MEIGIIVGNVTSVAKISELKPVKLFLVQLLGKEFMPKNAFIIAIDCIGVGFGDYVIITQGGSSRFTKISKPVHSDASIIARIDNFNNKD